MKPKANTDLTIRVQAAGGMFLGPDSFNGAIVTIHGASPQSTEPAFTDHGNSGTREPTFVPAATASPIITPATSPGSPPTVHWVVAAANTVKHTANFNLETPRL